MDKTSDQDIIVALGNAISPNISKWYGQNSVLQIASARLLVYPYSFFISFQVDMPGGAQILLAKIHRKPSMATMIEAVSAEWMRSAGRDEYEFTRTIWQVFEEENAPAFTAVQSFAFLDEWNAILMKKVEGMALKKYLITPSIILRDRKALARLQSYLAAAATWLRIFHSRVGDERNILFPVQDVLSTMTDVLGRLGKAVNVSGYHASLTNKLESIKDFQVPVALLHDDFQYSNILVENGGRVCVLDYALNHRSCVYSDIATLLIDPRTRGLQIWSRGWCIPQQFIQSLDQTILNAYFKNAPYHEPVLEFFCALAILNKWGADEAELTSRSQPNIKRVLSAYMQRYYEALLSQYL